jgi:hypothetical protein
VGEAGQSIARRKNVNLRILSLAALLLVPLRGQAQFFVEECAPLLPAVEDLLGTPKLLCSADAQQVAADVANVGLTLLIDERGALRGLANLAEPPAAAVMSGPMANVGSVDDTIFWGTWMPGPLRRFEGEREINSYRMTGARHYVAGISPGVFFRKDVLSGRARTPLPTTGIVDYRLLGRPMISSKHLGNPEITTDTDVDGNPIDPGPIENATVRVDFEEGTGVAEMAFSVRGVRARSRIPLERRNQGSSTFESVDCGDSLQHICPTAELRFYGRQGEFVGLSVSIHYQAVIREPDRVARRLQNVRGVSAIALRRE